MNLHINVIRGCCVHGYFQQRGWEDVKHAKPLCIYANWAPFSNLNMNLSEMNLFTSSLFKVSFCTCTQTALLLTYQAFMPCSWVRFEITALWDMWNCGFPMIFPFDTVLSWHSKYCSLFRQRGSEASRAYDFSTDANVSLNPMPKRLLCHKS